MAQQESPREDLLREATALVERIELIATAKHAGRSSSEDNRSSIIAGFRANGGLSVFFGEDPAYHFNAAGELRRAYVDGLLYKAIDGQLVSLTRIRNAEQVELHSHTLSALEKTAFIQQVSERLSALLADVAANSTVVRAQVPPDGNVLDRLRTWLANHIDLRGASRPNA